MESRDDLAGLRWLQVSAPETETSRAKSEDPLASGLSTDQATLVNAASEMAQAASEAGVRMEKVIAIQAALADGSYSVPASAVAAKIMDAMLGGNSDRRTER